MKKIGFLVVLITLLVAGVQDVFAGADAYGRGIAYLKEGCPTGAGKVYVRHTNSAEPAASSYQNCTEAGYSASFTGEKTTKTFYFWAKANSGYKFTGWYLMNAEENFELVTTEKNCEAEITTGTVTLSDAYWDAERYAEFVKTGVKYTFLSPTNGSYVINHNGTEITNYASVTVAGKVHLTATADDGYHFGGWFTTTDGGVTKNYFSFEEETDLYYIENQTIGAVFVSEDGKAWFQALGGDIHEDLNEAIEEAMDLGTNIVKVACTGWLDAGDYYIPAGVSLLVPRNRVDTIQTLPAVVHATSTLRPYRVLRFREGVNITCDGVICVGGRNMSASGGNKSSYVTSDCGVIDMSRGGHIELNSGAKLYCWGFIKGQDRTEGNNTTGAGTVTVNNGAEVWENYEIGDWRGGTATSAINDHKSTWKLFPFQSYAVQNVEVQTTYKYGGKLMTYVDVYGDGHTNGASFPLIYSSNSFFLLTSSTGDVVKWYDPTTDLCCFQLNGTASIGFLSLTVASVSVSSKDFYLPISNSMHLIIGPTCKLNITYPITMQGGSVIEIKPGAQVTLGANLYMFDNDEWGLFVHNYYFRSFANLTVHKSRGSETSKALLDDATLIVDGKLTINSGKGVYTSAGGARIIGNGGGQVIFPSSLVTSYDLHQVTVGTKDQDYIVDAPTAMNAAALQNEDGSYTKAVASKTFKNVNGRWYVSADATAKANHTFNFQYISSGAVNGTAGTTATTAAVYSWDKTGDHGIRRKWFNVVALPSYTPPAGAPRKAPATVVTTDNDWFVDSEGRFYNWTINEDWHQFIETSTENLYSCSDNKLYVRAGNEWTVVDEADEDCLFTVEDVKKALVSGDFIALSPNDEDPAYHATADATQYYICFEGCTWHSATKHETEPKAYIVEGNTYIWYNGAWLEVMREEPFFYTLTETNVPVYYEFFNGDWRIATPVARVTDGIESVDFLQLHEAFAYASSQLRTAPTITLLRDIPNQTQQCLYNCAKKTCHFDLNGHTVIATASNIIKINATGCTLVIEDNSPGQNGKVETQNPTTGRKYTVQLAAGNFILNSGTIAATSEYTSATALLVYNKTTTNINGGKIYAKAGTVPRAIQNSDGTSPVVNINGGEIISSAGTQNTAAPGNTPTTSAGKEATGVYLTGGTVNMYGGTITVNTYDGLATTGYGFYLNGYRDANTGVLKSVSTLNMYGGTVNVTTKSPSIGVWVGRMAEYTEGEPRVLTEEIPCYANIYGGTFNIANVNSATADGIRSYGETNVYGGTFNVILPGNSVAHGVRVYSGTTTVWPDNDPVFNVQAIYNARGVVVGEGQAPTNAGAVYNGTAVIKGGTFNVRAAYTSSAYGYNAFGVWVGDALTKAVTTTHASNASYYAGNYANAGTAIIDGGVFNVTAQYASGYGVRVGEPKTESGAAGYAAATATPTCTVNGGYFKCSASSDILPVNAKAAVGALTVNGGVYSDSVNLKKYAGTKKVVVLPETDANRPDYKYTVSDAYAVQFYGDAFTLLGTTYQVAGEPAKYSGAEPTKASTASESYQFDGWSSLPNMDLEWPKGTPLPNVTGATMYHAHFATIPLSYRVHLDARTNGGLSDGAENIFVTAGDAIGTLPTATKKGYTFDGWFTAATGGTKLESTTTINADAEYFAQFTILSPTLTWNLNGGKVSAAGTAAAKNATGSPSAAVTYGTTIVIPTVTKTGYTFLKWEPTTAGKMETENLTYDAVWRPNANTTYYVKHFKQQLDGTYSATEDEKETLTGMTDAYVTPQPKLYVGFEVPATQTIQITADGKATVSYQYPRLVYTLEWDAATNGGVCATPSSDFVHGAALVTPEATRDIYSDLAGWYTKAEGGDLLEAGSAVKQNYRKAYAQFTAATYDVTLHEPDGATVTPALTSYTYGTGATLPTDVTRGGYVFAGWWDNSTFTGDPVTTISTTDSGDKEFWGKWETVATVEVGGSVSPFDNLQAAFNFAQEEVSTTKTPTITLLKDITGITTQLTYQPADKGTTIIDLNGHLIEGSVITDVPATYIDKNAGDKGFLFEVCSEGNSNDYIYRITDNSVGGGGTIRQTIDYNGLAGAFYNRNGYSIISNITIECTNTKAYNSSSAKNVACRAVYVRYGRKVDFTNCTINATGKYKVYGVVDGGTTTYTNCEINVTETKTGTSAGVDSFKNTSTFNNTNITVNGTSGAKGLYVIGQSPNGTTTYNGTAVFNSGTVTVNGTSNTTSIFVEGSINNTDNVVSYGQVTVNGGTFIVNGSGDGARNFYVKGKQTTTPASGTAKSTANKLTVKGGNFKVSGTTGVRGMYVNPDYPDIESFYIYQGGYYSDTTNFYRVTAPVKAVNYWVLPTTQAERDAQGAEYLWKVRQAYVVTFKSEDGESTLQTGPVEKSTAPVFGGETPTKVSTDEWNYTFDGWSTAANGGGTFYAIGSLPNVTAAATYFAHFNATKRTYAVTWLDGDGEPIATGPVEYGVLPTYSGATPTKTGTAQYSYTFNETWDPTPVAVTGPATYTAQFDATVNNYSVTWNNWNDSPLEYDASVAYGATPEYNGETPTKPADAENTYAFSGWAPAVAAVTGNAVYTAQFTPTKNKYTITWKNYDGETLTTTNVDYNATPAYDGTPVKPSTETTVYTFQGWSTAVDGDVLDPIPAVTGAATYFAIYSESTRLYDIVWKNGSSTITTDHLAYGATPAFGGEDPTKPIDATAEYTFDGWSATDGGDLLGSIPAVSGEATYYAHYSTVPTVVQVTSNSVTNYFTTIDDAWTHVNGCTKDITIKMLRDATVASSTGLTYNPADTVNCTLDLNNCVLDGSATRLLMINKNSKSGKMYTFTITDTSTPKNGKLSNRISANEGIACVQVNGAYSKVAFKAGTLEAINTEQYRNGVKSMLTYAVHVNSGSSRQFAMTGGTIRAHATNKAYGVWSYGTTTISAGEIYVADTIPGAPEKTSNGNATGIYCIHNTTTIKGTAHIYVYTKKTTAIGLYSDCKYTKGTSSYTTNVGTIDFQGGTIDVFAETNTAYGAYAKAATTADAFHDGKYIDVASTIKMSGGTLNVTTPTTSYGFYPLRAAVYDGGKPIVMLHNCSPKVQISGGSINVLATSSKARGVQSYGKTTITGGTFSVTSATTGAVGISSQTDTTIINSTKSTPVIAVLAGTGTATYGVLAGGTPSSSGALYDGTLIVDDGIFSVTADTAAYAVYSAAGSQQNKTGTYIGNYASAGTVIINGGTFDVTTRKVAVAIVSSGRAAKSSFTVDAVTYPAVKDTSYVAVNGGYFSIHTTGDADGSAALSNIASTWLNYHVLHGGYYTTRKCRDMSPGTMTDVTQHYVHPKASAGDWRILPLRADDPNYPTYSYKIAKAYDITFNNWDGSELQTDSVEWNTTPSYDGADPTKPEDASNTYTFDGWSTTIDGDVVSPLPDATAAATYYARFTAVPKVVVGDKLDIIDWTASTLTINANGWTASGWPYTINGTAYYADEAAATAASSVNFRAPDRTIEIPYTGDAGSTITIDLQNSASTVISHHDDYTVPFIGTVDGTNASSIVVVNSGTLNISSDVVLAELRVRPEASVNITGAGSLNVGKLVLRTLPWQAASISGDFTADEVWYTRIAPNNRTISGPDGSITYSNDRYYQLSFPLPTMKSLNQIGVSHGAKTTYGKSWLLKHYEEPMRAEHGAGYENNWYALTEEQGLEGGRGYEMANNSVYYREFYFQVGAAPFSTTTWYAGHDKKVIVHYDIYNEDAANAGWNIIGSPLLSAYDNSDANPETGIKISELQTDGSYVQHVPEVIPSGIPFSYQASLEGFLSFAGSELQPLAPARRRALAEEPVSLQWLRLEVKDAQGRGDETSVLTHPTRYEESYKTGIDVAKQSFEATRAILYSSHAYGDMAFAGVADAQLEKGIALTLYSPKEQELTFSLRHNNWLDRMTYVWLIDKETGAQIDLLSSDYSCTAAEGTTASRFFLSGRFKAPMNEQGLDETGTQPAIYQLSGDIMVGNLRPGAQLYLFDAVGHMLYSGKADGSEVRIPASTAGVYMLSIDGQTTKLIISK